MLIQLIIFYDYAAWTATSQSVASRRPETTGVNANGQLWFLVKFVLVQFPQPHDGVGVATASNDCSVANIFSRLLWFTI